MHNKLWFEFHELSLEAEKAMSLLVLLKQRKILQIIRNICNYSAINIMTRSGSAMYNHIQNMFHFLHVYFYVSEKASSSSSGPLRWSAPRWVCGGHRQPVCSAEHRDYRHCEHSTERWQGAWHPGLGHGLHSDWCHHQCETSVQMPSLMSAAKYLIFLTLCFSCTTLLSSMETQVAHSLTL